MIGPPEPSVMMCDYCGEATATVRVRLYGADDSVWTEKLCASCEQVAAGDYPDNIELIERITP